jgi:hypothetical protein
MNDILRFVLGISGIVLLTGAYAFVSNSKFAKAKKQEIKKDIAEFGQCCGLENGICTFQPKLDKLNKIDIDAAKNKK